ncbi:unnamed protein product [Closterium sp. NIES-54]
MILGNSSSSFPPGFRFRPTDEELLCYYLRRRVEGLPIAWNAIGDVDLYKSEPWELPGTALHQDSEWNHLQGAPEGSPAPVDRLLHGEGRFVGAGGGPAWAQFVPPCPLCAPRDLDVSSVRARASATGPAAPAAPAAPSPSVCPLCAPRDLDVSSVLGCASTTLLPTMKVPTATRRNCLPVMDGGGVPVEP